MTKPNDIPSPLKSNHTAQTKWLNGQIAKNNNSIFLNPKKAVAAYNTLLDGTMGLIDNSEIEKFMARYLSESGIKKLSITLRVAETRAKSKGFKLQCNISSSSNQKLERFMEATGMNKGEVIDLLIGLADLKTIIKKEQQYEITM